MDTIIKQKEAVSQIPQNWERKAEVITADDVIDAYFKGKQDGKRDAETILLKQFQKNLDRATGIAEKFISEASKGRNKINMKYIHLRADSIASFSLLFIADKKDFVSDKFREVYTRARKVKKSEDKDDFSLNFSFMPYSDHLNESCIISDGYFLKYVQK